MARRSGLLAVIAAYLIWGLSPIFWKQVDAGAETITAHRVVWSFLLLGLLHLARKSWPSLLGFVKQPRALALAGLTGALVIGNWLIYIYAISSNRIVEASLGYFMNPLVSVLLGLIVLREKLRPAQWGAVILATLGVVALTVTIGKLPLISLGLAGTFGVYGLLRKTAQFGAIDGLTMETGLFTLAAAAFLFLFSENPLGPAPTPLNTSLLVLGGAVTATPLLLFAFAARRVPLSTVGLMQYIAPTLQFILGVVVYGEPLNGQRLLCFAVIWAGLVLFAADALLRQHKSP